MFVFRSLVTMLLAGVLFAPASLELGGRQVGEFSAAPDPVSAVSAALALPPADPAPEAAPMVFREAYCEAWVEGVGLVEVETDYLPRVVACEHGAAPYEALKAQAVAARTYLYYQLEHKGWVGDGQHEQVFRCGIAPRPEHYRAVAETRGQVLTFDQMTIAAFYVAGAEPSGSNCVARVGDSDPFNTERFVTPNAGRSGNRVYLSRLGYLDQADLDRNRGAMSQNGASCLANKGAPYEQILRFYYGEDIVGDVASGVCVDGYDLRLTQL